MKPFVGLIMKLSLIVVKCRISFRHRNQQKVLILRAIELGYVYGFVHPHNTPIFHFLKIKVS